MSIAPLSDLILDVAKAADPAKAQATRQKLAESAGVDARDFDLLMSQGQRLSGSGWSDEARARFFAAPTGVAGMGSSEEEAKRGLETLIVKMMVENMLPQSGASQFFGKGNAGGIWRSMLSDRLAEQMTREPGLGILKGVTLNRGDA